MRLLFILTDLPSTPTKGYQVRTLAFAKYLSSRHSVTVISANPSRTADRQLSKSTSILTRVRSAAALAWRGWPLQIALFDGPDPANSAARLRQEHSPDVVVVVTERLPFTAMKLAGEGPLVLDVVDALATNMERRARGAGWLLRTVLKSESRAFVRLSRALASSVSAVVVSSPRERAWYPDAHVILNGASVPTSPAPERAFDLVFSGNLQYWANVEAVEEMCLRVLPIVRHSKPNVRVLVAGADPNDKVRALCSAARVTLHANVADLSDSLRSARLALAPLLAATGMQIKVMEAIASGIPILVYPIVVEGLLDLVPGVVACSDARAMAETALAYLGGDREIAVSSPEDVSWDKRAAEFERLLEDAAG